MWVWNEDQGGIGTRICSLGACISVARNVHVCDSGMSEMGGSSGISVCVVRTRALCWLGEVHMCGSGICSKVAQELTSV